MIGDCLKSLQFADEIIVVDTGNTDRTNTIAVRWGAKVITSGGSDYSQFRNDGLVAAVNDWILYVDADERVTSQLQMEILLLTGKKDNQASAYSLPRANFFLGRRMHYGGWGEDDRVIRLFQKRFLKHWKNPLHEEPVFEGEQGRLNNLLEHHSHRDLSSMLEKTLDFTAREARLRYEAGHPSLALWRFLRVMGTEFWHRFIRLSAWKDGPEGIIDGIFQVFNMFIIYARLWELQQKQKPI